MRYSCLIFRTGILINHIILSRNVFFWSFLVEFRGFLILTRDLEKKRRKPTLHHTPTAGSSVVVAVSVPLPYGVDRAPLSWLWFCKHAHWKCKGGKKYAINWSKSNYRLINFKCLSEWGSIDKKFLVSDIVITDYKMGILRQLWKKTLFRQCHISQVTPCKKWF